MSLNAQAEDGKTAPPPRRIFCWARCSMMSRARKLFADQENLPPTLSLTAIR
ncbi:hypothetical protein LNP24_08090 [Klebsiella pneumoniae subsp. pneumoniae]|nr:hypothetical protein [Klebsiella pneumoniae subsp. pneumoniae]